MRRRTFLTRAGAAGAALVTAVASVRAGRTHAQTDLAGRPATNGGTDVTDTDTGTATPATTTGAAVETGYAPANGLRMYYGLHGEDRGGPPVLLLHGAFMTARDLGPLLPGLAAGRRVIVPELQGHGRTADLVERPMTYEGMADDCAALLDHLGVGQADVVGYSLGGATAIQLAVRHPALVRTLTPISAAYRSDGAQPELAEMAPSMTPEMFAGSPFETSFQELNPNPEHFPLLVEKIKLLDSTPWAWPDADIAGIAAPVLIVVGDADATTAEHAVAMYRLLGGGAMGDLAGTSRARLAILPGTTHFIPPGSGMLDRHGWLLAMIPAFLDAPEPVPPMAFE